jgi:uncharacterized cupin superfamily protein
MKKINLSAVTTDEWKSPKGRFRRFSQDISRALRAGNGEKSRAATCPFDLELCRLPPRAANWPYHSHSAQWEFYLIISGRGQVRTPDGATEVREGDHFLHPPGEPHQLTNTGATDLIYYVIADNPTSDTRHYPDSNKWALPGQSKPVRVTAAEFYDGEE